MDEDPSLPHDKTSLLDRILEDRRRLEVVLHGLSEDELSRPGADGWSIKDHLCHVAAWERSLTSLLKGERRWEAMGISEDVYVRADTDEMNDAIFAANRDHAAPQALAEFRRAHEDVIDALGYLSDEDLRRDYRHYQPDEAGDRGGNPVFAWFRGNTFDHYAEHEAWIRRLRAELGIPVEPSAGAP
jgi:uncharacterized protein (TIGR03083 family)